MQPDDGNHPEQGQGPAVKEAQDPVHEPVTGKMRRAEVARNLLKAIPVTQTAKPGAAAAAAAAAKDGAACPSDAKKRWRSNIVTL